MSPRPRLRSARLGALGIVLILFALFLPGPPPKTSDSTQHLVSLFADKRRLFIIATYLAALGAPASRCFLAPLHDFLHCPPPRPRRRPATLAMLGGAVASCSSWSARAHHRPGPDRRRDARGRAGRAFTDTTNVRGELS